MFDDVDTKSVHIRNRQLADKLSCEEKLGTDYASAATDYIANNAAPV